MKRRVVQVALVGALLLIASTQARATIPYLGGRVMPKVRIVLIPYGPDSFSSSAIGLATDLADYLRGAKSPVGKQSLYAQYGISDGQLLQGGFSFRQQPARPRRHGGEERHSASSSRTGTLTAERCSSCSPGPDTASIKAGDCGYRSSEGDGNDTRGAAERLMFLQTISRHVLEQATDPNGDGWAGVVGACLSQSTRISGPV